MSQAITRSKTVLTTDEKLAGESLSVVSSTSVLRRYLSDVAPYASYYANRIGKPGILGLSLCIFSLIAFLAHNIPLSEKIASQELQLDAARAAFSDRQSGKRSELPQTRAANFVGELPTPNDVPELMGKVVAIAASTGIALDRGDYEFVVADGGSISYYEMSLPVMGSYPQVRQFVEEVLATVPSASLDGFRLERDKIANRVIAADLKFSILIRTTK